MATTSLSKQVEVFTPTPGDVSEATAYGKAPPPSGAAFGAIAQLPIEIQVAFQQKLLAILALQLFVVGAIAGAFEWHGSMETTIGDDPFTTFLVVAALVGLLALLYGVRNNFPLNWFVLGLFSCVEVLGLLCVDITLDSNATVVNCGFTCITIVLMMVLTRWTKPATTTTAAALRSPYLIGLLALAGACAVTAIAYVTYDKLFKDSIELFLSALVQLCVMAWFCHEIKSLHKKLSPDEYMRGVVYFYTDLLVVVTVVLACVAGGGGPSGGEVALFAQPVGGTGTGEEEV